MKNRFTVKSIVSLVTMLVALSALCLPSVSRAHPPAGPSNLSEATVFFSTIIPSVGTSGFTEDASNATSGRAKIAIINAEQDALIVLDGGQGGDLFYDAKSAIETMTKAPFDNDIQAATAILELNEELRPLR